MGQGDQINGSHCPGCVKWDKSFCQIKFVSFGWFNDIFDAKLNEINPCYVEFFSNMNCQVYENKKILSVF